MANTSKQATKSIAVKGSTMTVLTILARSADIEGLGKGLDEITGGAPDFFDYDAAVIDFSTAGDLSAVVPPDWAVLRQTFLRCHLNLVAVRAAPSEWRKSTMQAGLTWVKESETVRTEEKSAKKNVSDQSGKTAAASAKSVDDDRPAKATRKKEAEKSVEKPMEPQAPAEAEKRTVKTMILDKPLRSGQRVYAPGDLIIIAAVHPGSEVIADGNINVYAPLRGRALAGARGDETARILSTCFEAELVSIAGVYLTFEPGTPAEVFGKPAQVRLDAGEKGKTILHVQPLGS